MIARHSQCRVDRALSARTFHGGLLRKAFVNSFSEALSYELRGTGVSATVSGPGATATEFADVAGNSGSLLFRLGAASPTTVAREGHAR